MPTSETGSATAPVRASGSSLRSVAPHPGGANWGGNAQRAHERRGQPTVATNFAKPARNAGTCSAVMAPDVPPAAPQREQEEGVDVPDFGYPRDVDAHYDFGKELGRGGNGVVRVAKSKRSGVEYACKSVPKVLHDPSLSDAKRKGHADALRREIEVMLRLRGTLNVACIQEVFEDDKSVHIVMELCKGGELWHRIGERHYSEQTVASYMRAVLRTLAQCHSHNILHRDVKPGNFMLLDEGDRAPLKAIDFGLAVSFDPKGLPRTDLGLEGTPWYMAPECLSSQVFPASDVWAAGVMAFQLLTGRFPFNDKSNPNSPSLAKVWRSILTDRLDFTKPCWQGISDEAKDFVSQLLERDPKKRVSAQQALQHPWLKGGRSSDRTKGKPLSLSVVQRIQRYSQSSLFKRTVLQCVAADMLQRALSGADREEEGYEPETFIRLQHGTVIPVVSSPTGSPLQYLYDQLDFGEADTVDRYQLQQGLEKLGYRLHPSELDRLMDQLDPQHSGQVTRSALAASVIDWGELRKSHEGQWLASVQRVFETLDANGDGVVGREEILAKLRSMLPPAEVERALAHALEEASLHGPGAVGFDFAAFLKLLRSDARDELDQYDDRMSSLSASSSIDRLSNALAAAANEGSLRGGCAFPSSRDSSVRSGSLFNDLSGRGGTAFKEMAVRGGRLVADAISSHGITIPK